jgi:cyanophycinase
MSVSGTLALVGGGEWQEGCDFDPALLAASGTDEVVVLAAAAAYEHPDRAVARATEWFDPLGAKVRDLGVTARPEAFDDAAVAAARAARFLYLADGSPLHLRSVLKDSPLWEAVVAAWSDGAVLAGSGAGAMVLCDPMVDPRGGAFTLGLGLVAQHTIIPHHDHWSEDQARRTLDLSDPGLAVVGVDERTALIRDPDGTWRAEGAGTVAVFIGGEPAELSDLTA